MIKLKDILLEMGSITIKPILDLYDTNPERVSNVLFPRQKTKSKQEVEQELRGLDYNEFSQFRDELGVEIEEAERTSDFCAAIASASAFFSAFASSRFLACASV